MKGLIKIVSAALVLLTALGCFVGAYAADSGNIKVQSAQSLFEPFELQAEKGCYYDLAVRLQSDKKLANTTLKLCFDSEYINVTECGYGSQISGAVTNITEQRQSEENNVITLISSGKFFDYTDGDLLVKYQLFVKDVPSDDIAVTLDFVTLTANETIVEEGVEDLNPKGDVKLISKGAVVGSGFEVSATLGQRLGDVNGDGVVNINDATFIQLYLVRKAEMNDVSRAAADTYADGKVSIRDATMIQLWLV